jgi:hypothetical protein
MTEQEMEIAFLRLEMINTKTRNSFLLETIKNLTEERERLIKESRGLGRERLCL